ncbi:MAG: hypothetical protein RL722_1238 [Pseudomonadota bacterium]|jgi:hypothetical protein
MSFRAAARFESEVARDEQVGDEQIHLSRLSGMAPADIDVLQDFTREECLLLIIRCPKRSARYHHGKVPPKTWATSKLHLKSDPSTGLVTLPNGSQQVSDYDLMCVYRKLGDDFDKLFFSSKTERGALPAEAQRLLMLVQWRLKSRFQHGAQDDYEFPGNPGVSKGDGKSKPSDKFMVFMLGAARCYPGPDELKAKVYDVHGLDWPYVNGIHRALLDGRHGTSLASAG